MSQFYKGRMFLSKEELKKYQKQLRDEKKEKEPEKGVTFLTQFGAETDETELKRKIEPRRIKT